MDGAMYDNAKSQLTQSSYLIPQTLNSRSQSLIKVKDNKHQPHPLCKAYSIIHTPKTKSIKYQLLETITSVSSSLFCEVASTFIFP